MLKKHEDEIFNINAMHQFKTEFSIFGEASIAL